MTGKDMTMAELIARRGVEGSAFGFMVMLAEASERADILILDEETLTKLRVWLRAYREALRGRDA
jgi:hypothetical protein